MPSELSMRAAKDVTDRVLLGLSFMGYEMSSDEKSKILTCVYAGVYPLLAAKDAENERLQEDVRVLTLEASSNSENWRQDRIVMERLRRDNAELRQSIELCSGSCRLPDGSR